ncbi:AhpA/YtjB family protein [Psychromonas hadalis]|uniref:AhpA/YtjB family protein n=1 Tax=Psychromonas hadalis TaxID=211669 RepID=UPI0003B4A04D|nr:AhpA/YtjB family protein [Psychromonas hadalis]
MNKKMYYWLRFLQISGLITVSIIIIFQLNELRITSNEVSHQQTEKFSYSLTNLAAAEASRYLAQKKSKDLQLLINDLSNDPMVRDATIYDHLGKILYQSKEPLLLPILLKINESSGDDIKGIIPYIAELYKEGEKIGYIRISLQQDHILRIIFDYQAQNLETLILLLSLSFLAGAIIMALIFRKAEAWYYRLNKLIPNLILSNKKE